MSGLERWLPSGVLILIALIQFALVQTRELTPWKGGGFGMFASTDALSMRTVKCLGLTEGGDVIHIDALDYLSADDRDSSRAMPSRSTLLRLGDLLIGMEFVPVSLEGREISEQLRRENPGVDWPDQVEGGGPFYRSVSDSSSESEKEAAVALRAIRLSWWKLTYEVEGSRLQTEALPLPEIIIGEWPGDTPEV